MDQAHFADEETEAEGGLASSLLKATQGFHMCLPDSQAHTLSSPHVCFARKKMKKIETYAILSLGRCRDQLVCDWIPWGSGLRAGLGRCTEPWEDGVRGQAQTERHAGSWAGTEGTWRGPRLGTAGSCPQGLVDQLGVGAVFMAGDGREPLKT